MAGEDSDFFNFYFKWFDIRYIKSFLNSKIIGDKLVHEYLQLEVTHEIPDNKQVEDL